MAIYRNVQLSFWTDNKVEDEFTPEDKYFYLYLLTNPQTNICGCYEVSYTQLTNQTGYNKDTVNRLIDRFENIHKIIKFNKSTKEMLILNWYKYNWSKSEDTLKGVEKVANHIKCDEYRKYIFDVIKSIRNKTPIRGPIDPVQASVSDTDTVINNIYTKDDNTLNTIKEIINYFNDKCNTNYKYGTKSTQKHISARLNEGFTFDDFKIVIDKMFDEWHGTDMEKYLRPETLFAGKFEGYLNRKAGKKNNSTFDEEKFKAMNDSKWQ